MWFTGMFALVPVLVACSSPATPPTALAPAPAAGGAIELVLTGGKIFTADPARPWAEAIAVRHDRIAAIGTTGEVRTWPGVTAATRVIELEGRVVIPGINDAHIHAPDVWTPHIVRLATQAPSLDETVAAARDAVKAQSPGTWILVPIGPDAYDDPRANRALLDAVTTQHPIMTYDQAGHAKLLNSAALKALDISDTEVDPQHGRYGRDPRTNRLNGWLHEYASYRAIAKLQGARNDDAIAKALADTEREALAYGITSLQTMEGVDAERFLRLQTSRTPTLRWRVIHWPLDGIPAQFERRDGARVRISGVKYIVDGTPIERGAWRSQPYADRPKERGLSNFTTDELERVIELANATGEQLVFHAVGDAAIEAIIMALEKHGSAEHWRSRRVRIEHGDMLTPSQIQRAAGLGMILVQNPVHFLSPQIMNTRLGNCSGVCQPLASASRAGLAIALGSDGPLNPFLAIMAATLHPTAPAEALTREQAVIAYTFGAAYAEGMEREKGMLAVGMLADLAVLDTDIFTIPPERLPATKAWMTIVGGVVAYDAGR